jgi:hypothetical protein
MRRRVILGTLAAVCTPSGIARAQQSKKLPQIGYLSLDDAANITGTRRAFEPVFATLDTLRAAPFMSNTGTPTAILTACRVSPPSWSPARSM